jgi:hypothetical protein
MDILTLQLIAVIISGFILYHTLSGKFESLRKWHLIGFGLMFTGQGYIVTGLPGETIASILTIIGLFIILVMLIIIITWGIKNKSNPFR